MFTVIVYAANEAKEYVDKAKRLAGKLFGEQNPKIISRHAPAYDPKQHEAADAIITQPQYAALIDAHEERDVSVVVATEAQIDQRLNPPKSQPPAKPQEPQPILGPVRGDPKPPAGPKAPKPPDAGTGSPDGTPATTAGAPAATAPAAKPPQT